MKKELRHFQTVKENDADVIVEFSDPDTRGAVRVRVTADFCVPGNVFENGLMTKVKELIALRTDCQK